MRGRWRRRWHQRGGGVMGHHTRPVQHSLILSFTFLYKNWKMPLQIIRPRSEVHSCYVVKLKKIFYIATLYFKMPMLGSTFFPNIYFSSLNYISFCPMSSVCFPTFKDDFSPFCPLIIIFLLPPAISYFYNTANFFLSFSLFSLSGWHSFYHNPSGR